MCAEIKKHKLFQLQLTTNRGIINVFTGQTATREQTSDMLSCRQIGMKSFQSYVQYHILKTSSTIMAPVRHNKILTMETPRSKRKRTSVKDKENKQVMQCLRRKLAWCKHNTDSNNFSEQFSVYPRALADEQGFPHKGCKSKWTDKLQSRYQTAEPIVFFNRLLWTPDVVLIDAMFLINVKPLRRTKTIADYASLLINQIVVQYYKVGTSEIHLIFDKPGRQAFNPKQFEHIRCYNTVNTDQHQHYTFSPDATIPPKWQDYLDCQECKRLIVEAIGLSLQGRQYLRAGQKLILSGCFSGKNEDNAWVICGDGLIPEQIQSYNSNAEEADNRIWRHAAKSQATRILIYSPDTDTYNIGLSLIKGTNKEYIIQINVLHSSEKKFLCLNHLHIALLNDPDLAALPRNNILETMHTWFICTGCNFISFFKSLGKITLLNNFYQYTTFIGSLHKTQPEYRGDGFLAFVRLIGTAYFKKHLAAFISLYKYETPKHLFTSLDPSLDPYAKHEVWLQEIRSVVNDRITTEEEKVPSITSLWRHWIRSCWVAELWNNSIASDVYSTLSSPENSGWICKPDGTYEIEWETAEVQAKIQSTIDFLLKGCNCKKAAKTTCVDAARKETFVVLDVCVKGAQIYLQLVMMTWMTALQAVKMIHQMITQVMIC